MQRGITQLQRLKRDLVAGRLNFDPVFRDVLATIRQVDAGRTKTPNPLLPKLKKHVGRLENHDPLLSERWTLEFNTKKRYWSLNTSPAWRALEILIECANSRELNRLRECPVCRRWFFATRKAHICCTSRCRQKRHASTPEFKEERRKYMRELRKLHKERECRALRAVQESLRTKTRGGTNAKRSNRKNQ